MGKIARHTPTLTGEQKIRAVSVDTALLPHLGDAITKLSNEFVWKQVGDPVDEIVAACKAAVESWYSDMLIGTVVSWLINPPNSWLLLDGSTYANADYPELSVLLPAHLISGDNFTLPDIGYAFPQAVQDEDDAGAVVGSNTLNLTVGQLPSHNHSYTPPVLSAEAETPAVPVPAVAIGGSTSTGSTGDGDDVDRRPLRFGLIFAVFAGR